MIRMVPGVGSRQAEKALVAAERAFQNIPGTENSALGRFNAYVRESNSQVRMLSELLSSDDVRRLIATPRYWTLQGLDPGAKGDTLASIVDLELAAVTARLELARRQLVAGSERFTQAHVVLLLDTNVYLHHPSMYQSVPWSQLAPPQKRAIIAVPMLVVDELDRAKRDHKPIARGDKILVSTRARHTLKSFEEGFFKGGQGDPSDLSFDLDSQPRVEVALWPDDPDRERLADADSDIVDTALALRELSSLKLIVIANDTGLLLRARTVGLEAQRPPELPSQR